MVKASSSTPTTTTRVICLTSSKSLTLTPSKTSTASNNSGAPLMIQRKKGKIEYFTLGANKHQNNSGNNTTPKKSGKFALTYLITYLKIDMICAD